MPAEPPAEILVFRFKSNAHAYIWNLFLIRTFCFRSPQIFYMWMSPAKRGGTVLVILSSSSMTISVRLQPQPASLAPAWLPSQTPTRGCNVYYWFCKIFFFLLLGGPYNWAADRRPYLHCYWSELGQTLKVGWLGHLHELSTVLETFVTSTFVHATFVLVWI